VLVRSTQFRAGGVRSSTYVENVGRAPVGTLRPRRSGATFIIRTFGLSVPELAKLIGRRFPAYIYQLRSLLTSLPSNARRDWQSRHPAATLPRLAAVSREFDKVAAWERVRGQHEKAVGRVLSPVNPTSTTMRPRVKEIPAGGRNTSARARPRSGACGTW
jgi:hypothetical protein